MRAGPAALLGILVGAVVVAAVFLLRPAPTPVYAIKDRSVTMVLVKVPDPNDASKTICKAFRPEPVRAFEEEKLLITILEICSDDATDLRIRFTGSNTKSKEPYSGTPTLEDKLKMKQGAMTADLSFKAKKFDRSQTEDPIPSNGSWDFDYLIEVRIAGAWVQVSMDPKFEIDPFG
jgi:hypothetical protein